MKKLFKVFTILCTALLFTSCYTWFEEQIKMDTEKQRINLGDFLYQEKPITSLNPPTQLLVSQGSYSNVIKIHWDDVPYANSYRIERAIIAPDYTTGLYTNPEDGDFKVLNKYVYSNTFVDKILSNPSNSNPEYSYRYYYRVCAENIPKGLESSEFTETSVTSCGWLLCPPSSIEAAKGENPDYIQVSWTAVPKVNKYEIYRGEKENGLGMEYLDSVTGNILSYKNQLSSKEKGVEFYYKVRAVLSDGSQSAFTGLALGYSSEEGAPGAPTDVVVTDGSGVSKKSLNITWTATDPHTDGSKTYSIKYALYRTSSIDSIYTLVRNNITTGDVTDESLLKPGIKYYYYVQTIATNTADSTDIVKSAFSKTGPGESGEAVGWLLSPPSNCEVADSDDASKSVIRWTPAVGYEDVDYMYNIYSIDTLDGVPQLMVHDIQPETDIVLGDDGYYTLTVDKKPFYRITTINDTLGSNLESDYGAIIAPSPSAPVNVTATKTDGLKDDGGLNSFTSNNNGVYPVKITWAKPAGENPYGYYVYRSTKPDSSFRKITDNPITDALSFIDENESARPGTLYYYKVVSLNVLMQGKNANEQSPDSRGYGALTREQWFREYNKTVKRSQAKLTLMHSSDDMKKLGSETINGDICGTLSYKASMAGLGARILMHYEKYADYYVNNDAAFGYYFLLTGDTNTTANMSANGNMDGTNTASTESMYPGYAKYDKIQIKGGGAGGGSYVVCTKDKNENIVLNEGDISWTIGEE